MIQVAIENHRSVNKHNIVLNIKKLIYRINITLYILKQPMTLVAISIYPKNPKGRTNCQLSSLTVCPIALTYNLWSRDGAKSGLVRHRDVGFTALRIPHSI